MNSIKIGWNIGKGLVIGTAFLLAVTTICHAGTVLQLSETSTFQDAVLQGNKMQGQITYSMAKGDFNGDGKADFAIGAPRESGPRTTDEVGMVMVFMGGTGLNTDLSGDVVTGKDSDGKESARLYATDAGDGAGSKLAVGDLNDDGIDDLVIGNKDVNFENCKIWVVFGKSGLSGDINLDTSEDVAILQRPNDSLNITALGVGDVNGDGKDDLLVSDNIVSGIGSPQTSGAPHAHPDGGDKKMNGVVYVVFGDLAAGSIDLVTEADAYILRNDGADQFQVSSIAIGDMSGDSKNDLVLGVQKEDNPNASLEDAGAVYVINGGTEFPTEKLLEIDTEKDTVIYGGWQDDQIGGPYDTETTSIPVNGKGSLAIGDVNNDGMNDLIIGSPMSMLGNVSSTARGKAEVVYGKSSGLGASLDLYDDADIRMMLSESAQKVGFKTGFAVSTDDVNGDGVADISVSTPNAHSTRYYNGWVHVFYGGSDLTDKVAAAENKTLELDVDADLAILAAEPSDKFADGRLGTSFVIGDFNDSGKPDMILGAPKGDLTANTSSGWGLVLWDVVDKGGQPGDVTCDEKVDIFDLLGAVDLMGLPDDGSAAFKAADLNGDGKVDIFDLLSLVDLMG